MVETVSSARVLSAQEPQRCMQNQMHTSSATLELLQADGTVLYVAKEGWQYTRHKGVEVIEGQWGAEQRTGNFCPRQAPNPSTLVVACPLLPHTSPQCLPVTNRIAQELLIAQHVQGSWDTHLKHTLQICCLQAWASAEHVIHNSLKQNSHLKVCSRTHKLVLDWQRCQCTKPLAQLAKNYVQETTFAVHTLHIIPLEELSFTDPDQMS